MRSRVCRVWRTSSCSANVITPCGSGSIRTRQPQTVSAPTTSWAALRAQNAQVSAGVLNAPPIKTHAAYQINVEALGRLTTPEQFGDIIVKSDNQGRVTRIRDIGRVELGSVDYGSIAYADRYPSAPWFPIATPGANVVQLENEIWAKMAELKKSFPPGLDYIRHLRSDDLRRAVHS